MKKNSGILEQNSRESPPRIPLPRMKKPVFLHSLDSRIIKTDNASHTSFFLKTGEFAKSNLHASDKLGLSSNAERFLLSQTPNSTASAWILKNRHLEFLLVPDVAWALNLRDELALFAPELQCVHLPRFETDLEKNRGPSNWKRMERIRFFCGLHGLGPSAESSVLKIFTVEGLAQRAPGAAFWLNHSCVLRRGQEFPRDELSRFCADSGYLPSDLVEHEGHFAIRGFIVDIYSPLYSHPLRIEFEGDEIVSIKSFHAESQRTLQEFSEVVLPPVREFFFPESAAQETLLRQNLRTYLDAEDWKVPERQALLSRFAQKSFFPTIDYWANFLTPQEPIEKDVLSRIQACLEPQSFDVEIHHAIRVPEQDFLAAKLENEWVPKVDHLYLKREQLEEMIAFIKLQAKEVITTKTATAISYMRGAKLSENISSIESLLSRINADRSSRKDAPLEALAERLREWRDSHYRVLFFGHNQAQIERAEFVLGQYGFRIPQVKSFTESQEQQYFLSGIIGQIEASFEDHQLKQVFLADHQIFGIAKRRTGNRRQSTNKKSSSFTLDNLQFLELKSGDFVVHQDHGIGKFLGTRQMLFEGVPTELLEIEYKDKHKLLLPVTRLNSVKKFSGKTEITNLDNLGGQTWEAKKNKVKRDLHSIAGDLLNLYSQRQLSRAPEMLPNDAQIDEFAATFPYQETPDQRQAIEAIAQDLRGPRPMDRLVCGDVGFGKTEVAMRAAHAAVVSGYQVAVLVPTTLLATQHENTFKQRFSQLGISVASVSRFRTIKEVQGSLEKLATGELQIVVGTHKLLSNDVNFKNLGLMIIDEEQRFGVTHKEKLKKLRANIHVLSMTATPIPRTLNMTMSGLKELSIMQTPPQDRLSVRTYVARKKDGLIQDAILKEIKRGGQVYYVHNRVETIAKECEKLRSLCPDVSMEFVHGQMEGLQLEKHMLGFFEGRTQVLVTTSIVESGLDVPNANTILIDRADNFGLAQLYQMRGRVGRSAQRAFAYLLLSERGPLSAQAEERLSVMESYQELGSGFYIASHDLEIRGAGDILGRNQSGQISLIGFETYVEMLNECVGDLKGEPVTRLLDPEIKIDMDTSIPDFYIPEMGLRLMFYRRLAAASDEFEIENTEKELEDRFGKLPTSVQNLISIMRVKCQLRRLGVKSLTAGKSGFAVQFDSSTPIQTDKLVTSIRRYPAHFKLNPDGKLIIQRPDLVDSTKIMRGIEAALSQLESWIE